MAKYIKTEEGYKDLIGIYNEIHSTPDWSDNDEVSPNYINNRTHYDSRELLWLVGNEDTLENVYYFDDRCQNAERPYHCVYVHTIGNVKIDPNSNPVAQVTFYDNEGQLCTYGVPLRCMDYFGSTAYPISDIIEIYPNIEINGYNFALAYYTQMGEIKVGLETYDISVSSPDNMEISLCIITGGELVQLADKYISQNIARTKDVIAKTNKIEYIPTENYHPATKKYVDDILQKIYPIGAIYLSMNSTSPASLFGGTWEQIQDRFLLGAGSAYTAGSTGGESTHTHDVAMRFASYYNSMVMEKHEKTGIVAYDEDGTKTATGNTRIGYTGESENSLVNSGAQNGRTDIGSFGVYETVGNTSYHSNMPPYLAVYMWKRIE